MENPYAEPRPAVDPIQEIANSLQRELVGLFQTESINAHRDKSISFHGRLLTDAESAFGQIRERFQGNGYTPMLRRRAPGSPGR